MLLTENKFKSKRSLKLDAERQTWRGRILYLGYLLNHDAATAKILAYIETPPLKPVINASKDAAIADIPAL
ncbi:hypothetical protein PS6_006464 [Mucor atramentarius]